MARRHPLLAKVTPPSLPRILNRPRLFRVLDRARQRPITWICAPPGSGKTTLVASYARSRRLAVLWDQLDAGDADPATFFHYLGLASRQASPRYRRPLPHLTPEYLPGLAIFARRFFEEVFARLKTPAVVVFDNYQDVPDDARFHELMPLGLSAIPHTVSVVVLSRRAPHPALGALQARRTMSVVDDEALRLTPTELRRLAALHMKGRTSRSRRDLDRLYQQTQGWFAGAVLFLDPHHGRCDTADGEGRPSREILFDYLASEAMKDLDADTHTVLLKTSLLPSLSVSTARALTGVDQAGEILARLHRARYFTERRSDPEPTYQYHPLFREFLQARAATVYPPEELRGLRETAARLLEGTGLIEEAGALYQEARQHNGLVRLALTHAPALFVQGRSALIEQWIGHLPLPLVEQTPWLLYWRANCLLPVSPAKAQPLYMSAYEQFQTAGDRAGALLAWCGVVDAIWYAWEDLPQMDPWIERFATLMPEGEPYPSPEIEAAVACAMFNALFWRRPAFATIAPWAAKVMALLESAPVLTVQMGTTVVALVNHYTHVADLVKAERVLRLVDHALRRSPPLPFVRLAREQTAAVLAYMHGDAEQSAQTVVGALELAKQSGVPLWNVPLCGGGCLAALITGDLVAARRYVDQMLDQPPEFIHLFHSWALMLDSIVSCETGDLHRALQAAESSLALTEREGPWPESLSRLSLAVILHHLRREAEADAHLARAAAIADDMQSRAMELHYRIVAAQLAFDRQDDEAGLRELRAAFKTSAETGLMGWQVLAGPRVLARLCARALEAGIETDFARRLITRRKLMPDATATHLESWPWPVKVYTLGRFSLVRDQRPVAFRGKAQKRPLELLKALIALGGREVGEARIIEALWPEAEGDAAYYAYTMALKRLRELLGSPEAVRLTERKLTLNPQLCWVDIWAFERGLGQSAADPMCMETALAFYRGPFLGADDAPWALSPRERTRAKFLNGVRTLGARFEAQQQWAEAIQCYQRGLHVDDLAEEFYQRLMICHQRLGQRGEALSAYQRCKNVLATHLAVAPSAVTESIRAALTPPSQ
ncbi:MAG: BTAD domain-containing putative transcriptional regulator [Nitrospirota bacterium]